MGDYRKIDIKATQSEAMRFLTEYELDDFWNGLDIVRETGCTPRTMHPVARVLLYWVLSENGIDHRDLPCEGDK